MYAAVVLLLLFLAREEQAVDAACAGITFEKCAAITSTGTRLNPSTGARASTEIDCSVEHIFENEVLEWVDAPDDVESIKITEINIPADTEVKIFHLTNVNGECQILTLTSEANGQQIAIQLQGPKRKFKITATNPTARLKFECVQPSACDTTFIGRNLEPSPITLGDNDLLLKTQSVTSEKGCELLCCETEGCCKAVYTQDCECLLYTYIKDSELPIPEGATVFQEQCCYEGEHIMGEVTIHLQRKNIHDSMAHCAAENTTLVMPKTECAYKLLADLADVKRSQTGAILWVGINNPEGQTFVFDDGETPEQYGFTLPLGPPHHEQEYEQRGIFYDVGGWKIGDWNGYEHVPFICQSNIS